MFLGEAALPQGNRLYAIGDVHGRADLLDGMIDAIAADLASNPVPAHQIVTLGDYTDRGPDSFRVIETLQAKRADEGWICLRGNHDQWIIDFLDDPLAAGDTWQRWGGRETLLSYGVETLWEDDPFGVHKAFRRALSPAHRQFFNTLPFSHEAGDFFFAHAGVKPGVPLSRQLPRDLMWIRDEFLLHTGSHGKVVIHGHTPSDWVDVHPNRINADTWAYHSGMLSAVVLEGREHRTLSVQGTATG